MTESQFAHITDGHELPERLRRGVVAIGNFDGVHRGHRAVLGRALQIARERGVPALAVTFEPHPRSYFRPDQPLFRLTPAGAKAELIAALGLDAMVEIAFDAAFAATPAEVFVDRILVGRLDAAVVVVGFDFHFGKGRSGTPQMLAALGRERGFDVVVVEKAGDGEAGFSSSAAREALAEGRVEDAASILGYRWFVRGEIVHGEKRGRELGFPTANMRLPADCGLRHGIYAVRMRVGGTTHDGVASYGRRPQFDNGAALLETFLFDVAPDLYGETVEVEFVGFIRPEARFASIDDLIARMHEDARIARRMLAEADAAPGDHAVSAAARVTG